MCQEHYYAGYSQFSMLRRDFSARSSDHITPLLLRELHWLKITERIQFRLCVFAYRCLHGSAPHAVPRRDTAPDVRHRGMSSSTIWLYVDFVRAGDQTIQSRRSGTSCGHSAIMEHSPGLPANSFILPDFSPRTQDVPV